MIAALAPFLAALVLAGLGAGAAYLLQTNYNVHQIAAEQSGAALLLIATMGSFVLALLSVAIGGYATLVCWIIPR